MTSCIAIVPCRYGSKSIPRKNHSLITGLPLYELAIRNALLCKSIAMVVVSTNDPGILSANISSSRVRIIPRPDRLCSDESPISECINHVLSQYPAEHALLYQPTSPFIFLETSDQIIDLLKHGENNYFSAQSISRVKHNSHYLNQRLLKPGPDNIVEFRFPDERKHAYNKQLKDPSFIFGNLIGVNANMFLKRYKYERSLLSLFDQPSGFIEISTREALDVDQPDDLVFADYLSMNDVQVMNHIASAKAISL